MNETDEQIAERMDRMFGKGNWVECYHVIGIQEQKVDKDHPDAMRVWHSKVYHD